MLTACDFKSPTSKGEDEVSFKQKVASIKRFAMNDKMFGAVLAKKLSESDGIFTLGVTNAMFEYMKEQAEEDFNIAFYDYMFQEQGLNLFLTRSVQSTGGIKEATYTLYNKYKFKVKEGNQLFEQVPLNMLTFRHNEIVTKFICGEDEEPQIVAEELTVGENPQYGADLEDAATGKRVLLKEKEHRLLVIPYCSKAQ